MVDLHCHILPGVDDGAETMADALEMARIAARSGVRAIAATPHCNVPGSPMPNYLDEGLMNRVVQLREAIDTAGIPLDLYAGAEIFCTPQVGDLLQTQRLLTLAGSRYLLTEFYFDESPEFMDHCFRQIRNLGCVPVIAHPERYDAVQRNPALVQRWFHEGSVIQLNKGTILGSLGSRSQASAQWILRHGLAHVVASDAHGIRHRTPHMAELRHHLESHCGPGYTRLLLSVNPGRILRDQETVHP